MTKEELISLIEKNDRLYWNGEAEISDIDYDKLIRKLGEIDPNHPLINKVNTSSVVGEKIIHKVPMLSLEKVYKVDDLKKWMIKFSRNDEEVFKIQPKYDGISAKIEDGIVSTRGNGWEGTNITNVLGITNIETNICDFDVKKDFLLGEIVIKKSDFETKYKNIKSKNGQSFCNSRNAVSGIVALGKESIDFYKEQGAVLTLVDYEYNSIEIKLKEFDEKWEEIYNKLTSLDYPMDGIVVKIKDEEYGKKFGKTDHHPRNQMALKFANKSKMTKLLDIEWGMGKDGITSVARFETFELGGVKISTSVISLTPPANGGPSILGGDVAIGDILTVERAGDVIPHIVSIIPHEGDRKIITLEKCPFCGSEIKVNGGRVICLNENCEEKKIKILTYQLVTLGIFGVAESAFRSIKKATGVDNLLDFLKLKKEDLQNVERFGDIYRQKVLDEIVRITKTDSATFLTALNVPGLWKNTATKLLKRYTVDEILNDLTIEKALEVFGNGCKKTVENIVNGLNAKREYHNELKKLFTLTDNNPSKMIGKTICFTGKSSYKRSEMEMFAKERGYIPVDNVTKELDLLVTADLLSTSSKIEKAKKMGIDIISEKEFFEMKGV